MNVLLVLVDDRPRAARRRVDFNHAIDLVPALVVFERERAAVALPFDAPVGVRIREERAVDDRLLLRRDVEEHGLVEVHDVARLPIEPGERIRLKLIVG